MRKMFYAPVLLLLRFGGNPASIPVELQIRAPGSVTPLQVHTLALNASGGYSLAAPLDGVYDLSAKASHWLRQTLASVSRGWWCGELFAGERGHRWGQRGDVVRLRCAGVGVWEYAWR